MLLLGDAKTQADLGAELGGSLTEREVMYLKAHVSGRDAPEDVLWRRTKIGLHMTADERSRSAEADRSAPASRQRPASLTMTASGPYQSSEIVRVSGT